MASIKSFEDLQVWQEARLLVSMAYKLTKKFPRDERFGLVDQIRRCAISISANIAEGFSRYHLKETVLFYRNSRGSLSELKSHFYLAFDQKYLTKHELELLFAKVDLVGRLLNGLIRNTENFRLKLGSKL